ncbi:MAG: hypothetical protein M3R58_04525 [Pseudomonadota bacterium]|nr:hypothetical protein [Pseudomonadota bacterium]
MEQIKLVVDLSQEQALERETAVRAGTHDVRTLSDLELVLCGGGDGIICW